MLTLSAMLIVSCKKEKPGESYAAIFIFSEPATELMSDEVQSEEYQIRARRMIASKDTKAVTFDIVTDELEGDLPKAQEGIDYSIPSKTINFNGDDLVSTFTIQVNPVAESKQLMLRMKYTHPYLYPGSEMSKILITLSPN